MKEVEISKYYKLREDGKIFNIKTGEEVTPTIARQGYCIGVKGKTRFVHQLVMEYFGVPKPDNNYKIWHKNKDKFDNRLENLEWVTSSQINSRRPDALPIGERRCDYDSIEEYNRAKCRRHYANHPKEQYQKNKEKRLMEAKKYRLAHREVMLERTRQWRQENKDKIRETNKINADNRTIDEIDEFNKKRRERYANIPEIKSKKIQENIQYAKENKEKVKIRQRLWYYKNKNNPEYKIKCRENCRRYRERKKAKDKP